VIITVKEEAPARNGQGFINLILKKKYTKEKGTRWDFISRNQLMTVIAQKRVGVFSA